MQLQRRNFHTLHETFRGRHSYQLFHEELFLEKTEKKMSAKGKKIESNNFNEKPVECFIQSNFFHVFIRVGKEVDSNYYNHQQKFDKMKNKYENVHNFSKKIGCLIQYDFYHENQSR